MRTISLSTPARVKQIPLLWQLATRTPPSLLRFAENALSTAFDLLAKPPTKDQKELGRRFQNELNELAAGHASSHQMEFWRQTCAELAACANSGNPLHFMRWPPIASTMVPRTTAYAIGAYGLLRRSPAWQDIWKQALEHPQYGDPPPFLPNLATNAAAIQHASHLVIFRQEMLQSLTDAACIIELGGGYGSMCRLVRRLGYEGKYLIFDQPAILALQRFYLGLHGIEADYAGQSLSPTVL